MIDQHLLHWRERDEIVMLNEAIRNANSLEKGERVMLRLAGVGGIVRAVWIGMHLL